MINEDGIIYILGRTKDVIKRGGIPITPAALESCIETFTGSQSSVVGISHPVLGQVPFAVVVAFSGRTEESIRERVTDLFGKDYALAGVATLEQLGLNSFPLNATDKIMKIDLVRVVKQYLKR